MPRAILFDLDGTLADTAPDLAAALNRIRADRNLELTPYEKLRPYTSRGARGMIGAAFNIDPQNAEYPKLQADFLNYYFAALAKETTLFEGIPALLKTLRQHNLRWGIVTNKATRFTQPLIAQIGLTDADCVICGDTTPHAKPHPAPLREAAKRLNLPPQECWYVGDDIRDIQAGRAAGMKTIAVTWGYSGETTPDSWEADALIDTPEQLLSLLLSNPV